MPPVFLVIHAATEHVAVLDSESNELGMRTRRTTIVSLLDQHRDFQRCRAELFERIADRHQCVALVEAVVDERSEENTSELQSLMRNSYAACCLQTKKLTHYNTDR